MIARRERASRPRPTSTTTPAPSWPSTAGNRPSGSAPESVYASVWQTPVALISISTSPARGPSTSMSSMTSVRLGLERDGGSGFHVTSVLRSGIWRLPSSRPRGQPGSALCGSLALVVRSRRSARFLRRSRAIALKGLTATGQSDFTRKGVDYRHVTLGHVGLLWRVRSTARDPTLPLRDARDRRPAVKPDELQDPTAPSRSSRCRLVRTEGGFRATLADAGLWDLVQMNCERARAARCASGRVAIRLSVLRRRTDRARDRRHRHR